MKKYVISSTLIKTKDKTEENETVYKTDMLVVDAKSKEEALGFYIIDVFKNNPNYYITSCPLCMEVN